MLFFEFSAIERNFCSKMLAYYTQLDIKSKKVFTILNALELFNM